MRALVLSDIHANFAALKAVLRSAEGQWDQCWVLGDTAGYGPDFMACFHCLLNIRPAVWLAGNHDACLLDTMPESWFSPTALWAIHFQRKNCRPEDLSAFRQQLELTGKKSMARGLLVHGSPSSPLSGYLLTESDKLLAVEGLSKTHSFFCYGHTHQQEGFCLDEYRKLLRLSPRGGEGKPRQLLLFNPGSVGQPRDRDPRACYAIFDLETLQLRLERVGYPLEEICDRMRQDGFPSFLYQRLKLGR